LRLSLVDLYVPLAGSVKTDFRLTLFARLQGIEIISFDNHKNGNLRGLAVRKKHRSGIISLFPRSSSVRHKLSRPQNPGFTKAKLKGLSAKIRATLHLKNSRHHGANFATSMPRILPHPNQATPTFTGTSFHSYP